MPSSQPQPRTGPGRRRADVEAVIRRVSWRDFQHLRRLLWVIGALCVLSWIGLGVTVKLLVDEMQANRVHNTRQICRSVNSLRIQTRDGFRVITVVAKQAGLSHVGVKRLHRVVIKLSHPPAKQSCRAIVAAIRDGAPHSGPNP
jgi:hypothetical protein